MLVELKYCTKFLFGNYKEKKKLGGYIWEDIIKDTSHIFGM
jgi:hypothetical protein